MEKTIDISEQDLRTTLSDFLEEKEKKPNESIWNFSTLTGIVLVLASAAFVGNFIGTTLFDFNSIAFITLLVKYAPYIGGALLGSILISTFIRNKQDSRVELKQEKKVKQTYDKLDEFLYSNSETKTQSKKKSSHESFKINSVHRLMKSRTDKKISGVCGGLAKYLGINSTIIRIIFVAALLLGYGSFLLVYFAMALVMPKEPVSEMDDFF